jgi:hypothetical protein
MDKLAVRSLAGSLAGVWLVARAASALALPPLSGAPADKPRPEAQETSPAPVEATSPPSEATDAAPAAPGGEKYVGVVPSPDARNPLPPARKAPPHLIWSGFQSGATGSRVFFQTNLPVTFDLGKPATAHGGKRAAGAPTGKPATLSVFLRNCRIHLRNNSRHLDTRFFPTPVEGVTVVQRHKDVELRISLKQPATATPRTEAGPDGTQFLVLEFPPGQPVAEGRTPADPDVQR